DSGDRGGVQGVGPEPVDRLGRERDQPAAADHLGRPADRDRVRVRRVHAENGGAHRALQLSFSSLSLNRRNTSENPLLQCSWYAPHVRTAAPGEDRPPWPPTPARPRFPSRPPTSGASPRTASTGPRRRSSPATSTTRSSCS